MKTIYFGCYLFFHNAVIYSPDATLQTTKQGTMKYVCTATVDGPANESYNLANTGQFCVIPGVSAFVPNWNETVKGNKATLVCTIP